MKRNGKGIFFLPPIENPHKNQSSTRIELTKSIQNVLRRIKVKDKNLPQLSETFQAVKGTLGLTSKQVIKLYRNFQDIDADDPSFISCQELFHALEEEETHLTNALFTMMDPQNSGLLSFDDFARLCSIWCLYTKRDILKFCFDTFDDDKSGFIDEHEFKLLCTAVNKGSAMFHGNFDAALQIVDDNGDGVIDFHEFMALDKRFPLILFPIFRLQEKMQKLTLGDKDWIGIRRRVEKGRCRQVYKDMHGVEPKILKKRALPRMTRLPPLVRRGDARKF
eukprot:scaffold7697_cov264-Chaetoceros_neogracile.AAC.2